MLSRPALLATILMLFLLAPPAAWAQSAGDEQYDDPFAGQEDQGSSAQPAPTATPAPAPAAAAPAAQQAAPAQAAPTASAAQLPRTGAETLLTALAGVGLVMAGVGLRLRLPADGG
jgi:LPXTG-motif cell wall-anchored protein